MGGVLSRIRKDRRLQLLAAFGVIYLAKVRYDAAQRRARKKAERKAKAAAEEGKGGGKPKKKKRVNTMKAMSKLAWQLFPFGKSKKQVAADPTAGVGKLEILAILAVSVLRTWHQDRTVYIKRDLMKTTFTRDWGAFRGIMVETAIMSLVSSLIFATHRFLKERLALLWREKLTRQLHSKYFKGMNYYKLSHLNQSQISDVEERIVKDPRRFCKVSSALAVPSWWFLSYSKALNERTLSSSVTRTAKHHTHTHATLRTLLDPAGPGGRDGKDERGHDIWHLVHLQALHDIHAAFRALASRLLLLRLSRLRLLRS